MPIETFNFITDLVPSNPIHTDLLSEADSHIRGLKQTLVNTFPHVAGATTCTNVDLNGVTGLMNNGTLTVAKGTAPASQAILKGASSATDVTIKNTSGTITVNSGTLQVASLDPAGSFSALGPINGSVVKQAGSPLIPTGVIVMWSGSVASIPAGWHLCDGTTGTPDLRDRFVIGGGGSYTPAATGGGTTATATTATAGAHSHGGAALAGGAFSIFTATDIQGAHAHGGQTAGHALSVSEMPSHGHGIDGHVLIDAAVFAPGVSGSSSGYGSVSPIAEGGNQAHIHGITTDGAHGHNYGFSGPDHTHAIASDGTHSHSVTVSTMSPYYALALIMKL